MGMPWISEGNSKERQLGKVIGMVLCKLGGMKMRHFHAMYMELSCPVHANDLLMRMLFLDSSLHAMPQVFQSAFTAKGPELRDINRIAES